MSSQRICECGRPAIFLSPKKRRFIARDDHDRCRRCWKDQRQSEMQRRMANTNRLRRHADRYVAPVSLDSPRLRVLRAVLVVLELGFP